MSPNRYAFLIAASVLSLAAWTAIGFAGGAVSFARTGVRPLLRVRLFTKILVANSVLVSLSALAGALAGAELAAGSERQAVVVAVPVVLAGLVLTVLVDAVILQLALDPLHRLERAAERVGAGDLSARAPRSALADRDLARLVDAFNDALERVALYRRKLGEAAARAVRREEEERDRVARALQEDTAQRLAALLLQLRITAGGPQRAAGLEVLLEETRREIAAALDVIRDYAVARRPRVLDELGLEAAVEAYGSELEAGGLRVEVDATAGGLERDPALELDLYRIVREALDNVVEHSDASRAIVHIARDAGRVAVSVEDDGRGFDVDAVLSSEALGLFEMRERAVASGGTLLIDSRPGGGTRIRATVGDESKTRAS
ncbi:MAG TPA: ATP-binding protein [Gemmatimonadota bacterium]|nr:ATP-binding protein [Gemmatimonadota bacterium]